MGKKNKIDFDSLSAEEIQNLTGKDLEAYNAHVLAKSNAGAAGDESGDDEPAAAKASKAKAPAKKESYTMDEMKALGKNYFKDNSESLLESVHVTSDGQIFPGSQHGKNACDNYKIAKASAGAGNLSSIEVGR